VIELVTLVEQEHLFATLILDVPASMVICFSVCMESEKLRWVNVVSEGLGL
jgi:hypothetical protein